MPMSSTLSSARVVGESGTSGASSSGGRTGRLATVDPSSPGRTVYEFTATTAAESRDAVRAAAEAS
ncbi:MAG TPA: hypothetical protein VFX41_03785, partial [Actinomycetales bacterium]|nr:hypothetical protein [Actinomycetales bacterium]